MSGYASNIYYIDDYQVVQGEESAGKGIGKILGVVAAIAIPFAAPAIFGAIAASGVLGTGLAAAATSGTIGALTSTIGAAAVGGIMNAGIAYASGARGGDVWQAAGMGALQGGIGGYSRAASAANAAQASTNAGTTMATTPGTGLTAPGVDISGIGAGPNAMATATNATAAPGVMNSLRSMFGAGTSSLDLNRIGAAIVNAAVNGQSMGRLDGLVARQRAELEALKTSDRAVYDQRIAAATQMLHDADKMDPAWMARVRMADVAGMEAIANRQAMRNIATRKDGSLDEGQKRAYERSGALHTARSKALVYNKAYTDGQTAQQGARAAALQGLGPDTNGFAQWQAATDLEAGRERARQENEQSTWGGLSDAFFGPNYRSAASPDPTANNDDNSENGGFFAGLRWPQG